MLICSCCISTVGPLTKCHLISPRQSLNNETSYRNSGKLHSEGAKGSREKLPLADMLENRGIGLMSGTLAKKWAIRNPVKFPQESMKKHILIRQMFAKFGEVRGLREWNVHKKCGFSNSHSLLQLKIV